MTPFAYLDPIRIRIHNTCKKDSAGSGSVAEPEPVLFGRSRCKGPAPAPP